MTKSSPCAALPPVPTGLGAYLRGLSAASERSAAAPQTLRVTATITPRRATPMATQRPSHESGTTSRVLREVIAPEPVQRAKFLRAHTSVQCDDVRSLLVSPDHWRWFLAISRVPTPFSVPDVARLPGWTPKTAKWRVGVFTAKRILVSLGRKFVWVWEVTP